MKKIEKFKEYTEEIVKQKLIAAIRMVYKNDYHLIKIGANERSITHRLAIYLEGLFPEFNVDCEYNRNGRDPKRDTKNKLVLPDVIVHLRGQEMNLLVIEVKKDANKSEKGKDEDKIKSFIASPYNYQYGVFIDFKNDVSQTINFNFRAGEIA